MEGGGSPKTTKTMCSIVSSIQSSTQSYNNKNECFTNMGEPRFSKNNDYVTGNSPYIKGVVTK
jgi:hypothetical protein